VRILITGANGQLGREIARQLVGSGHEYLAAGSSVIDITNQRQTAREIADYHPDAVLHCAAYTNVDGAETDQDAAYKTNAVGTQNVAQACLRCGARMVYVSTDYVFDGTQAKPYSEFDQPNPQSVYGKSKYAGERLAGQMLSRLFIVRTAWLYGDGNNFVRTMLRLGGEKDELRVVNDQFGSPSYTRDVAQAILKLVQTESYGIYHAVNAGVTTWYDFARTIFTLCGYGKVKVSPQTTAELTRPAPRPQFSQLENRMLPLAVGHIMPSWQDALADYLRKQTSKVIS
jgi:dTDP-4-dehydrorhamnose reductase